MNIETYNAFCGRLRHATHVVQWGGSHVWKIGGKVFAIATSPDGGELAVTFKCSQLSFDMLKTAPGMRPAPYLASRGLIWLQRVDRTTLDDDALEAYLRESYRLASLNLPKAKQRELRLNPQE